MPKALAKKITRKQARSYTSTVPNPIGVTAISSVNGRGAYARRYAATRQILEGAKRSRKRKGREMVANRKRRTGKKRVLSAKQRAALAKGREALKRKICPPGQKRRRRRAATGAYAALKSKRARRTRSAPKKRLPSFFPSWAVANRRSKPAKKKRRAKSRSRTYGRGRYRALSARVGSRVMPTYVYTTRKGRTRKIPDFALAGYRSRRELKKVQASPGSRRGVAARKRFDRLYDRRKKAADRVSARILAGKYPFTPNARRRRRSHTITSFRDWEQNMLANARKKKSKSRRKRGRRVGGKKSRVVRYKHPVKANRRIKKRRHRKVRRHARRNPMLQAAANRRRTKRRRRHVRRNPLMQAAANKRRTRRRRRHARRNPLMQAAANRRRTRRHRKVRRHARRNPMLQAAANKHRRRRSHGRRRSFLRNQAGFVNDFMNTVKVGLPVGVGFVGQKILTKFLSQYLGFAGVWKSTLAGAIVAAVGVPLLAKTKVSSAARLGAGMGAAFVHTLAMDALTNFGQPGYASYLGDYTERQGSALRGMGSYYEFQPSQQYAGMGEYFEVPAGVSGFGATPMLSQAAAGTGEYFVEGAQGIGEYEQVTPEFSPRTVTRDGIRPNLASAERELSQAEAAAGVGSYGGFGANNPDVNLQNTVYPEGQTDDIPDSPGGSRAGVFCGDNGVFGPCS